MSGMSNTTSELAACPFCGSSELDLDDGSWEEFPAACIECKCGASMTVHYEIRDADFNLLPPDVISKNMQEALRAVVLKWNARNVKTEIV